jgi:hypothetical protein
MGFVGRKSYDRVLVIKMLRWCRELAEVDEMEKLGLGLGLLGVVAQKERKGGQGLGSLASTCFGPQPGHCQDSLPHHLLITEARSRRPVPGRNAISQHRIASAPKG